MDARRRMAAATVALLLAGCSGGGAEASVDAALQESFCADLDDGVGIDRLYAQAVGHYEEVGRSDPEASAAVLADAAVSETCPEHRDVWESSGPYQEFYG